MPLKWKIYYVCALYLLLWASGFFMYAVYGFTTSGFGQNVGFGLLALSMLLLAACKAVSSLKATGHYKQTTLLSQAEYGLFIAGYCFIILFAVLTLLLSIFDIIPADFTPNDYRGYLPGTQTLLIDVSFFLADIIAFYFAITDLMLLKAIKTKQLDNLISFELEQP